MHPYPTVDDQGRNPLNIIAIPQGNGCFKLSLPPVCVELAQEQFGIEAEAVGDMGDAGSATRINIFLKACVKQRVLHLFTQPQLVRDGISPGWHLRGRMDNRDRVKADSELIWIFLLECRDEVGENVIAMWTQKVLKDAQHDLL